jgi:hypothetical protein
MKKFILAVILVFGFGMGTANAVPVTLNVDEFYDWGRLYDYHGGTNTYTTTNNNPKYYGPGSDTTLGKSFAADTVGIHDTKEDTWGVGNFSSIKTYPTNDPIWAASASEELTFMFYGFDDDVLASPLSFNGDIYTQIQSIGGHIQVYLDNAPDFHGSTDGPTKRTAVDAYTGATNGELVLDLVPVVFDGTHTLSSYYSFSTNSGGGNIYLATTGLGSWDSYYDTNTQAFGSDFHFTYTLRDSGPSGWVVHGDGGAEGNVVPEPMSLLLLGGGLAGLFGTRRRFV